MGLCCKQFRGVLLNAGTDIYNFQRFLNAQDSTFDMVQSELAEAYSLDAVRLPSNQGPWFKSNCSTVCDPQSWRGSRRFVPVHPTGGLRAF